MRIVFRLLTACLLVCLFSPQLVQADGDRGQDPYEIGEKYFARKDYVTALKLYRKALDKNDTRAHYRMGLIYENAGRGKDALVHYRRFIELAPPGDQRNDAAQRVKAIEKRLKRKPTRPAGLLEQGKSLFKKGKYLEAQRVLLQAASRYPSNPEIHFYLGEVSMELEDYGKAESEYSKAKGFYRKAGR